VIAATRPAGIRTTAGPEAAVAAAAAAVAEATVAAGVDPTPSDAVAAEVLPTGIKNQDGLRWMTGPTHVHVHFRMSNFYEVNQKCPPKSLKFGSG
jgi:hypothetical protein